MNSLVCGLPNEIYVTYCESQIQVPEKKKSAPVMNEIELFSDNCRQPCFVTCDVTVELEISIDQSGKVTPRSKGQGKVSNWRLWEGLVLFMLYLVTSSPPAIASC